jgi:GTP-binding protein
VVSEARPKIADYPFTTLQPNLGVVLLNHRDLVMADIPGLIEGAHLGAGLGHEFLRHVERSRFLVHLLNGANPDPVADFHQLNEELALFSPQLAKKPQLVVLNKIDLPEAQAHWQAVQTAAQAIGWPSHQISAVTKKGVEELVYQLFEQLDQLPPPAPLVEAVPTFTLQQDAHAFEVEDLGNAWRVTGPKVAQLARQTLWDVDEAVTRAYFILEKMGVHEALRKVGVQPGDTVILDDVELEWVW